MQLVGLHCDYPATPKLTMCKGACDEQMSHRERDVEHLGSLDSGTTGEVFQTIDATGLFKKQLNANVEGHRRCSAVRKTVVGTVSMFQGMLSFKYHGLFA